MFIVSKSDVKNAQLITESQLLQLARKVVARYVHAGTIPAREQDDVQMAIVEKFLIKQDKILNGFSGKSKITTYCIAVLNRMCCEIIRKELKHWKNNLEYDLEQNQTSELSTSEQLVINDEVELLDKIIQMFDKEQAKVIAFLAFYYSLQPEDRYLYIYCSQYRENGLKDKLNQKTGIKKSQIFEVLAEVVNTCEEKCVKPDAVRMWLNKSIEKIIERLNGPFQRANYDKDSLQVLFEYFYSKRTKIVDKSIVVNVLILLLWTITSI